ncbi:MAG: hypothetical protein IJO98_05055 [Clostridia bacterium]|nr:hypothetical protein [Clostridia bacterium]
MLALGSAGMMAAMYWGFPALRRCIAFADETVIAAAETWTVFLMIPAWICLIALFAAAVFVACRGLPDGERDRKAIRRMMVVTFCFVLLSFASLNSRVCLHEDGSLSVYSAVNRRTVFHAPEDVRTVKMGTCSIGKNKYSSESTVRLELLYPDSVDSYIFYLNHFRGSSEGLSGLEALKSVYSEQKVHLSNKVPMDDVAEDQNLSEADRALAERILEY